MRIHRPATGAALAALTVAALTGIAGVPAAFADPASTLYVDHDTTCSDTGSGTQALPFCTIQAAANAVQPGQTVQISEDGYDPYKEFVRITASGTASQPITFTSTPGTVIEEDLPGDSVFMLSEANYVHLESMKIQDDSGAAAVYVSESGNDTLDQLVVTGGGDGVNIDWSHDITVSRSQLNGLKGIAVNAGYYDGSPTDSNITVTTNVLRDDAGGGVWAAGTTGLDITSNTFGISCTLDAQLKNSTGSVQNNVFTAESGACDNPAGAMVNAYGTSSSPSDLTVDYNAFEPNASDPRLEYGWFGKQYATPAAFQTDTGQGAHDIITGVAPAGSTVVDSADADAPGELTTDINGNPHVDDPKVDDTGAGTVTYADRGDTETQDTITVPASVGATPAHGAVPFSTSVPVGDATSAWGEPLTFSVDFGDGSAPVTGTSANPPTHTYTTPGAYTETVTATDADGVTATGSTKVVAATAAPAALSLSTASAHTSLGYFDGEAVPTFPHTDDFEMASGTIDFGDGSGPLPALDWTGTHLYGKPGRYTVKLSETDVLGRTSTATATYNATDDYAPTPGNPVATGTIPAHGTWTVPGSSIGVTGPGPAELRVNATGATAGGWLTAYAAGTTRPSASTLNFPAGENASNQETIVPNDAGSVTIYNGAASSVKVSVQAIGGFGTGVAGDSYHPVNPTTLLDTRYSTGGVTGPIGAGKSVSVRVAGANGVPANAQAVTLDVAENTTKASGSLTVAPNGTSGEAVTASYWATGESVTNLVTLPLTNGMVTLTNNSKGTANLIAALAGWYSADTTGSGAWPVTPTRVLNTQTGIGETSGKAAMLAAHGTLKVKVAGTAGLPATGLTAADLNLTVSAPTASGWLIAYPDGTTRPTAGCVNYTKGHTIAGQAVIKVGSDGYIDLYNPTSTAINVFADIHGADVTMTPAD